MDIGEFTHKWNSRGGETGLRVVIVPGGAFFANSMRIQTVKKTTSRKTVEYEGVVFSKVVANMVIDTGTMRLDRIKEIL